MPDLHKRCSRAGSEVEKLKSAEVSPARPTKHQVHADAGCGPGNQVGAGPPGQARSHDVVNVFVSGYPSSKEILEESIGSRNSTRISLV